MVFLFFRFAYALQNGTDFFFNVNEITNIFVS